MSFFGKGYEGVRVRGPRSKRSVMILTGTLTRQTERVVLTFEDLPSMVDKK